MLFQILDDYIGELAQLRFCWYCEQRLTLSEVCLDVSSIN